MEEGHKLLLELADLLDVVPAEKFNMQKWGTGGGPTCGTAACALGWATTLPAAANKGLVLKRWLGTNHLYVDFEANPDILEDWLHTSANARSFQAAQKIFDISEEEAYTLFGIYDSSYSTQGSCQPCDYFDPKKKAAHIREFCRSKWGHAPPTDVTAQEVLGEKVELVEQVVCPVTR